MNNFIGNGVAFNPQLPISPMLSPYQDINHYNSAVGLSNMGVDAFNTDVGSLFMNGGGSFNPMFGGSGYYGSQLSRLYYENPAKYYEELSKMQQNQIGHNITLKNAQEAAEFTLKSRDEAIIAQAGRLQTVILENNQFNVIPEYKKLCNNVAEMLLEKGAITKSINGTFDAKTIQRIENEAQKAYYEATGGSRITDDLIKHGDSNFVQGAKEGFFGLGLLFNQGSMQDNLVEITGVDNRTSGDKLLKGAGFAATATATAGLTFVGVTKLLNFIAKFVKK